MPTIYGNWVPSSSAGARMRLRLDYTVSTPSTGSSSVRVSGALLVEAGSRFYDSSNALSWSGIWGAGKTSTSINVSSGGTQLLRSFATNVQLGSTAGSRPFSASLSGVDYVGATASISGAIPIPARILASAPSAPMNVTVTRVDNERTDLRWTQPSPDAVWNYNVDRWASTSNSWYRVGNPVAEARSLRIPTGLNERYRARVRASNSVGQSAWAYSPYFRTAPSPATGLTLEHSGGSLTARWTNTAKWASTHDVQVQSSADGGSTWTSWTTTASGIPAAASSRALSGLDSSRLWRFRVVTWVREEVPTPLSATSVPSGSLTPLTAPKAPTLSARATQPAGEGVVGWRHNPVDGTAQTAFELRVREKGGAWVTVTAGATAQGGVYRVPIPADMRGTVEWQARTKGAFADWSPWSLVGTTRVVERPTVSIISPEDGARWASNVARAIVSYADAQGEAAQQITVAVSGPDGLVGERTKRGVIQAGSSVVIEVPGQLVDGATYTLTADVLTVAGVESGDPAISTFTVEFVPPPVPEISARWEDETGTVNVAVSVPEAGPGREHAETVRVERSDDGGDTWQVVADELPPDAGYTDWQVPLGTTVSYRAVAVTALGAETVGEPVEESVPACAVYLHASDGLLAGVCRYNLSFSHSRSNPVEFALYLGDEFPTPHFTQGRDEEVEVSADFPQDEIDDMQQLIGSTLWYRDPEGRSWWATLSQGGISTSQSSPVLRSMSFTATRVEAAHD